MTIPQIIGFSAAYLMIGYAIAHLGLEISEIKNPRGLFAFILFPKAYMNDRWDRSTTWAYNFVSTEDKCFYLALITVIWPVKMLLNTAYCAACVPLLLTRMASKQKPPTENGWERYDRLLKKREKLDRELGELKKKLEGGGGAKVYRLWTNVNGEKKKGVES